MAGLTIRIAGNTEAPCYFAIRSMGYDFAVFCHETTKDEYIWTYEATKEGRLFSATTIQELLGLIAMWEQRGDDWRADPDEGDEYLSLRDSAPVYDLDGDEAPPPIDAEL